MALNYWRKWIFGPDVIHWNGGQGRRRCSMSKNNYVMARKKLSGLFFETALPNEYLVEIGKEKITPKLGGRRFRLFKKFIRVPANVQTLHFSTDNANVHYQGIGVEGFATWRINPADPAKAIQTLDFFDAQDPMQQTNEELKTICIEAVRHTLANMSIDEALRQKEEIAEKLHNQLKSIEDKWGIIFDQVGIEKVRIMSNSLFEELQSQYRNELRLESEKTRIETDKQISSQETAMQEVVQLEKISSDRKVNQKNVENDSELKNIRLEENRKVAEKERSIKEEGYRQDMAFKLEQEQKKNELDALSQKLKIDLQSTEIQMLETQKKIELLNAEIELKKLEVQERQRAMEQSYTPEALHAKLISQLPEIFAEFKIDKYTVLDTKGDEGVNPITRMVTELMTALQTTGANVFGKDKK
jgi:hypothetical protein